MISLNPAQQEAVNCVEGPLLLLAGAGSGKTRVITARIAHMLELGINPFSVLALTFTNKAAREMRERINQLVPEGDALWVSTFHSSCVRILRREIKNIGYTSSFTIYDSDDSERLIKQCIKEVNINEKQYAPKIVMDFISKKKNELISPDDVIPLNFYETNLSNVYSLYQKKLMQNNALDFDDIIFNTVKLFMANPNVLNNYQERFKYICIDEYQDTNTAQYRLVRLLADKYKNICVVGDDDQSIYGWRGANVRNILDFEKDFSNAKVIKLEQNYRSNKLILDAANAVIENNIHRKSKSLWTENPQGDPITMLTLDSEIEEGMYIAGLIKHGVKSGRTYKDYAVLYRNNSQSRAIEEQLVAYGIPYRLFGGVRFYERREIKDLMAYLRLINNPKDDVSLARIINFPRRGIGDTTLSNLRVHAASLEIPIFSTFSDLDKIPLQANKKSKLQEFYTLISSLREAAQTVNIDVLLNMILEKTGFLDELRITEGSEGEVRVENVKELVSKAANFANEYITTDDSSQLEDFLAEVSLIADVDNYNENEDSIIMMTIHSAKGLEFPVVILPGFEEGIFPGYRAQISSDERELEEERRLCYVALTRAKEKIFISCASSRLQFGQRNYNLPSRFLKEIPKNLFESKEKSNPNADKKETQKKESAVGTVRIAGSFNNSGLGRSGSMVGRTPSLNQSKGMAELPTPKQSLDFKAGDRVRQAKYGEGVVKEIKPAGADFEVSVEFDRIGVKKFMGFLSKMVKTD